MLAVRYFSVVWAGCLCGAIRFIYARVLKMILLSENVQVNVDLIMEEEMPENLIKKKQSENVLKVADKVPLNFSVERLLAEEQDKNCNNKQIMHFPAMPAYAATTPYGYYQSSYNTGLDPKILHKPTPIRMLSNASPANVECCELNHKLGSNNLKCIHR